MLKKTKGILIILSGPSGVGKGTIRKVLMKDKSLNLVFSISMTTRLPRNGETNGVEYYFVSKEEFEEAIKNNELLEWAEFVGNKYGTPRKIIEKLREERKNVLLEIEVNGTEQVLEKLKDDKGLTSIFLVPPNFEALEARIRGRSSEPEEIIQKRLNKARREMKLINQYEHVIVNDDINKASEEMRQIIVKKIKEYNS